MPSTALFLSSKIGLPTNRKTVLSSILTSSVATFGHASRKSPTSNFCSAAVAQAETCTSTWHNAVPDGAYDDFVCVDGLQRITAILRFLGNEFPAFGSYYREFEDRLSITNTVRVHVNDLKSKKEVLTWYIEMNAGGTPHSKEEIDRVTALRDAT